MARQVIEQIHNHIKQKNNFLLSGGAGSGKTHTLTQVIDLIRSENPIANIACITFTNVAADEIKSRSPHNNLRVSTIHDFLWDIIKKYQQNLKTVLCELINNNSENDKLSIKYDGDIELNAEYFKDKAIEYKDYRKLDEGIIWHDDVLKIAHCIFEKYPLLCQIVKDKYPYILVDEYQDTDKLVIDILLNFLQRDGSKSNVIGFFGDSMQSIYDDKGIGNIQSFVDNGSVKEVKKDDNYRCSMQVIGLINQLRNDGIIQNASGENKPGKITFLYSNNPDFSISNFKANTDIFNGWDFNNPKETKELYLTHKLIAREYGFTTLLSYYKNSERLLGDENNRDKLANHLLKIQELISLYEHKKYNDVITKTSYKILKLSDKNELQSKIEDLKSSAKTIEDLISLADRNMLVPIDDKLNEFIKEDSERYDKIKELDRIQVEKVYNYIEGYSPYSTQHGIKGAEFENVFVVLDNGNWSKYNFKYLFENTPGKEPIIDRTRKVFYVCCSRAKNNLVVFFHKPSATVIAKAKIWFGEDNVREI